MSILKIAVICWVVTSVLFILGTLVLRKLNFKGRKVRWLGKKGRKFREQNRHDQNERVYRAFEFFFKVTIVLFGGVAVLLLDESRKLTDTFELLLKVAGWLYLVAAFGLSAVIFIHLKSKIERWEKQFSWYSPFVWMEYWFVSVMLVFAVSAHFGIIPELIKTKMVQHQDCKHGPIADSTGVRNQSPVKMKDASKRKDGKF